MVKINRILLWAFIGLATGIAVAEWGDIWWLIILGLSCGFLVLLWRRPIVLLLAATAFMGFVYWNGVHPQRPDFHGTYLAGAKVLVLDRPQIKDGEQRFVGLLQEEGFKVRVFLPVIPALEKGDLLEISGSLREIRGPSNPGDFDYREFWAHRGIFYNLRVNKQPSPRVITNQSGFGQTLLNGVIRRGHQTIQACMSDEQVVLLEGMLFGFQGEISEEQYALFQQSGLVHIFSVSGFHVGFIVLIGIWVANRLGKSNATRFFMVFTLIMLYGFMTGWPSPMARASIMACLGLMAHYFGREEDLPTSLALAGIVLLLINPANLFEISFQLSFLATWGLIFLYPRWRDMARVQIPWEKAALLSLAPQVATLPLACYYFNLVSLISVVSNLLLVNVAGGAVVLGFLGVVVAQCSQYMASFFMVPAGFLTALVQGGAGLLGGVPGSFLWVAQPKIWAVMAAYAGMLLLFAKLPIHHGGLNKYAVDQRERWSGSFLKGMARFRVGVGLCLIAIFAASLLIPGQFRDPGLLRVVFMDVGQGDAIFVKTPQGFTVLVDGGGSELYDVGQEVVLPYLRRQGIRSIDLAIATHPHIDHLQGLKSVLKDCPARMVVAGQGCFSDPREVDGDLVILQGLREIYLDRATRMWLWAPGPGTFSETGNETSVICRILVGNTSFLLTGDAGVPELELLMNWPGLDLSATVLKLPHHGSRYSWSETFINQVNPRYGVVCAGWNNPFGHPNREVLERAQDKGIRVFRTDLDGAVTFLTRGEDIRIYTGP